MPALSINSKPSWLLRSAASSQSRVPDVLIWQSRLRNNISNFTAMLARKLTSDNRVFRIAGFNLSINLKTEKKIIINKQDKLYRKKEYEYKQEEKKISKSKNPNKFSFKKNLKLYLIKSQFKKHNEY
ncbi:hypothetical protein BpHYR1_005174 [Brachionus plicatilis]|uniref:Uncharacterized protein n=1 Tax=Brachionus plicatilis TaxID=10195 RepID=A0A3M7RPV0_BRAPC|nr:hypothetical protein BpHYR1_005174 [Brachionus plicatilis]